MTDEPEPLGIGARWLWFAAGFCVGAVLYGAACLVEMLIRP